MERTKPEIWGRRGGERRSGEKAEEREGGGKKNRGGEERKARVKRGARKARWRAEIKE